MNLLIEKSLVDDLIRYLSQRPWAEVAPVIPALLNLKPAEPVKSERQLMDEHHGRYGNGTPEEP